MTDAEQKLWSVLRDAQLNGFRFRRQEPIRPYVADFVCRRAMLIIEIDGWQHGLTPERDQQRTRSLEARGFTVLRFWNNEVLENVDGVVAAILAALAG